MHHFCLKNGQNYQLRKKKFTFSYKMNENVNIKSSWHNIMSTKKVKYNFFMYITTKDLQGVPQLTVYFYLLELLEG